MFVSHHTLKWTRTCRSHGRHPHAHTAHFLLNRHTSETNAISAVAKDPGIAPESLRRWCNQSDAMVAEETRQSAEDAMAELRRLQVENAELRRANEILTTASAFFAAGLDPTRC